MTDSTHPTKRSKGRSWWLYLTFALAAIGVLAGGAFSSGVLGLSFALARLFERNSVGTPDISGQVVDIVTGERVPGMDVCLLETYMYSGPTDGGPHTDVRRGEVTQTDSAGIFSFDAAKARLDFFQSADRYSMASDSAGHRQRHYFPVSIVDSPVNPPPVTRSTSFLYGSLPDAVCLRTLDYPSNLRIELIPLLQNESECQGAYDTASVELCRQANTSVYAEKWRAELSRHP
jgi:hypothetical protein